MRRPKRTGQPRLGRLVPCAMAALVAAACSDGSGSLGVSTTAVTPTTAPATPNTPASPGTSTVPANSTSPASSGAAATTTNWSLVTVDCNETRGDLAVTTIDTTTGSAVGPGISFVGSGPLAGACATAISPDFQHIAVAMNEGRGITQLGVADRDGPALWFTDPSSFSTSVKLEYTGWLSPSKLVVGIKAADAPAIGGELTVLLYTVGTPRGSTFKSVDEACRAGAVEEGRLLHTGTRFPAASDNPLRCGLVEKGVWNATTKTFAAFVFKGVNDFGLRLYAPGGLTDLDTGGHSCAPQLWLSRTQLLCSSPAEVGLVDTGSGTFTSLFTLGGRQVFGFVSTVDADAGDQAQPFAFVSVAGQDSEIFMADPMPGEPKPIEGASGNPLSLVPPGAAVPTS
jgi:hypothetical protein